jgi:hypothetical protein
MPLSRPLPAPIHRSFAFSWKPLDPVGCFPEDHRGSLGLVVRVVGVVGPWLCFSEFVTLKSRVLNSTHPGHSFHAQYTGLQRYVLL